MSANIKDDPGFNEHLNKHAKKQFANEHVNDLIKKIINKRQKNERLKTSKRSEGLCYMCEEYNYVLPTIVDCCARCTMKRNKDAVLAIAVKGFYGFCFICGNMSGTEFKNNWAQLNVRVCSRCAKRVRERGKRIKRGTEQVDPFWKYYRKRMGKDYRQYAFPNMAPSNFWKK